MKHLAADMNHQMHWWESVLYGEVLALKRWQYKDGAISLDHLPSADRAPICFAQEKSSALLFIPIKPRWKLSTWVIFWNHLATCLCHLALSFVGDFMGWSCTMAWGSASLLYRAQWCLFPCLQESWHCDWYLEEDACSDWGICCRRKMCNCLNQARKNVCH